MSGPRISEFLTQAEVVQDDPQGIETLSRNEVTYLYSLGFADNTVRRWISDYNRALKASSLRNLPLFHAVLREPEDKQQARKERDIAKLNEQRQTAVECTPEQKALLLSRAEDMLGLSAYSPLSTALQLVTGRRRFELFVTIEMELIPGHEHFVMLSGFAKKNGEFDETSKEKRNIPMLLNASLVYEAFCRLRKVQDCRRYHPTQPWTDSRARSVALDHKIGKTCRDAYARYLKPLIPAGTSQDSSVILRDMYLAFAGEYYPPEVKPAWWEPWVLGHEMIVTPTDAYRSIFISREA